MYYIDTEPVTLQVGMPMAKIQNRVDIMVDR